LQHSETAVAELARLMVEGQSEQVRVAACREILDRAHGKSRQSVEHTGHGAGPIAVQELPDKEKMRRLATFLLEDGIVTLDRSSKAKALTFSGLTKTDPSGVKGIKDDGEDS
jgi:Xaa-Pro aminopeptidase